MHAITTTRGDRNRSLGIRPTRSEHKVTLRIAEFNQLMADLGNVTNLDVARFLDLGEGTVSRLRSGTSTPGASVIAAFTKKLPAVPLRRVFNFGDDQQMAVAA